MVAVDPAAVERYCKTVFADPLPGSYVALRGLPEPGKGTETLFDWVDADDPRLAARAVYFARECHRRGIAAFCIPGFVRRRGGAGAADIAGFSTVCADFDTENVAEKLNRAAQALGNPALVVNSGGEVASNDSWPSQPKRHAYWRIKGASLTPEKVGHIRALISAGFGADAAFAGRLHQPIRIAGSVHQKGDPKPVTIAYADPAPTILHPDQVISVLERMVPAERLAGHNSGRNNPLGFANKVSLDELPFRNVGHGDPDINRFEAITRFMGSLISGIHDIGNSSECDRQFGYFRDWAIKRVENVERDYNLKQHWRNLLNRERRKRAYLATRPRRRVGIRT